MLVILDQSQVWGVEKYTSSAGTQVYTLSKGYVYITVNNYSRGLEPAKKGRCRDKFLVPTPILAHVMSFGQSGSPRTLWALETPSPTLPSSFRQELVCSDSSRDLCQRHVC